MKRFLLYALPLIFLLGILPGTISAATVEGGKEYTLKQGQRVQGNLYVGVGTAAIAGTVDGDLVVGGGTVLYSGSTTQDVIIAGGTVTITGSIEGDLRILGGTVTIGGPVHGDVAVAGGQVRVESTATIGGDLLAAGGEVRVDGIVQGSLITAGGVIHVDSRIDGDALIAADSLSLEKETHIGGDLRYRAPQKAQVVEGAVVGGHTIYKESKKLAEIGTTSLQESLFAFLSLWIILKFIMTALVALVIALLFTRLAEEVLEQAIARPWRSVLIGFALLVSIPVAVALTLISIVGAPLGILAILAYIFFLILAVPLGATMLGAQVIQYLTKSSVLSVNWQSALLGVFLYTVIGLIPIIGWIVQYALILATFGALSHFWNEYIWRNR